jgi:hypothetical protein
MATNNGGERQQQLADSGGGSVKGALIEPDQRVNNGQSAVWDSDKTSKGNLLKKVPEKNYMQAQAEFVDESLGSTTRKPKGE